MKEFEKHIKSERMSNENGYPISYCGERLSGLWYFENAEHYLAERKNEGRLLPCPECKKIIFDLLNK
jgi:hypothetical protein